MEKSTAGSARVASKKQVNRTSPKSQKAKSYSAKVRSLLEQGLKPSEVHRKLGGNIRTIYGINYKLNQKPKKILIAPYQGAGIIHSPEFVTHSQEKKTLWQRIKSFFGA